MINALDKYYATLNSFRLTSIKFLTVQYTIFIKQLPIKEFTVEIKAHLIKHSLNGVLKNLWKQH